MPLDSTAAALLEAVQASPRAVAAHDRAAWVGLFHDGAEVSDPVGARAHIGRDAIERFYDTFIAPNTIEFTVEHDIVSAPVVVRDLTIRTTMSTGAAVVVPMHLRYDLVEVDGTHRIERLAAHWELGPMILKLMGTGVRGLGAGTKLGGLLIKNQGLSGTAGMMRGLSGVGKRGKAAVEELFTAVAAADLDRVIRLATRGAALELAGTRVTAEEFTNRARTLQWNKLIAAGHVVSASIELDGRPGVAFIEFATGTTQITSIQVFVQS
ncbi:nuclear transport factor 2 family protein [Nocardia stercoris]|uniref:SnoaL-like domain-containing protein n=1 Tax=Nocardia stercoris TaxID=2483361 RepID=A0A3M2L2E2_9NOCA|nr:nuclear transport factor 2 family protein [Nocardia stercoris]RMI31889.1 hypothetical protein EBN03_17110 [Nocardia stercoris]